MSNSLFYVVSDQRPRISFFSLITSTSIFPSGMDPKITALIAGIVAFTIITALFSLFHFFCNKKRLKHLRIQKPDSRNPVRPLKIITVDESASFDASLDRISMPELIEATDNFKNSGIIGEGGFGYVYRARLKTNQIVAVKKLSRDAFQGVREFKAEVDTIGKIRHKNLVKILGYCISGEDRVLIYEFIENGSLDQWLHENPSHELSWEARLKIIKGVAAGLSFLHDDCKPQIIHRDIKSSNVLLDSEFESHIADFGLARTVDPSHSHVSTQVAGTLGYMPPEYRNGLAATVKADVYTFGVLMFEVLTGLRPHLPVPDGGSHDGLLNWVKTKVGEKKEMEILDSFLRENLNQGMVDVKGVQEFMRIASFCTSEEPKDRPLMSQVVSMLDSL